VIKGNSGERIVHQKKRKPYTVRIETYLGMEIPRKDHKASTLEKKNGKEKWKEAMKKEIDHNFPLVCINNDVIDNVKKCLPTRNQELSTNDL